jgi:hypothetical protein
VVIADQIRQPVGVLGLAADGLAGDRGQQLELVPEVLTRLRH